MLDYIILWFGCIAFLSTKYTDFEITAKNGMKEQK